MPKRLVSLHFTAPPDVGGVEIAAAELAAIAAKSSGWESLLISGTQSTPDSSLLADGANAIYIPQLSSRHPLVAQLYQELRAAEISDSFSRLVTSVRSHLAHVLRPADVVVVLNGYSLPYNLALTSVLHDLAISETGIRQIAWCHDTVVGNSHYDWSRRNEHPWHLMWHSCPNVTYAATTPWIKDKISHQLSFPYNSIHEIPNGLSPDKCLRLTPLVQSLAERTNLLHAYPIIFIPCKISRRKNLAKALSVHKHLQEYFPNPHLVISGSPSPHDSATENNYRALLATIETTGLRESVSLLSECDGSRIRVAYEDVMAMMLLSDATLCTSTHEGFLVPILEAALCGRPIFVPDIPEITSWRPDNAIFYSSTDPAQKVAKVIEGVLQEDHYMLRHKVRTEQSSKAIFDRIVSLL